LDKGIKSHRINRSAAQFHYHNIHHHFLNLHQNRSAEIRMISFSIFPNTQVENKTAKLYLHGAAAVRI
jgi:hypothetical protein